MNELRRHPAILAAKVVARVDGAFYVFGDVAAGFRLTCLAHGIGKAQEASKRAITPKNDKAVVKRSQRKAAFGLMSERRARCVQTWGVGDRLLCKFKPDYSVG
jgi:hypothetical protein